MKDNKVGLLIGLVAVLVLVLGGVFFASTRREDPMAQFKPEEVKAFNDLEKQQRDIYKRAGGVWEKMSPEDKATFMANHWDREDLARRTWGKYANENSGKSASQLMAEAAAQAAQTSGGG
jgi:uncharacterized protein YxeA